MAGRKTASFIILIFTLVSGLVCLSVSPDTIAVHWDAVGTANGFMSTYKAVAISTAAALLCIWIWHCISVRFENDLVSIKLWHILTFLCGAAFSCIGIVLNLVFIAFN